MGLRKGIIFEKVQPHSEVHSDLWVKRSACEVGGRIFLISTVQKFFVLSPQRFCVLVQRRDA